jgi:predicted secreted protein
MLKYILLLFFITGHALAARHQVIDTLGVSPKGQYVALEEYGYQPEKHVYYVTIKVMNVWKKEYVGEMIEVEQPAMSYKSLIKAREKAKSLAQDTLIKYKISG